MTKEHDELKWHARLLLKDMGFDGGEIFEEYKINVNDKIFRVDVVGIKKDRKVAIECGKTPAKRIPILHTFFDEVILFPHNTKVISTELERTLLEKEKTIGRREEEIESLRNEIESLKQNFRKEIENERGLALEHKQERQKARRFAFFLARSLELIPQWSTGVFYDDLKVSLFKEFVEEIDSVALQADQIREKARELTKGLKKEYIEKIKAKLIEDLVRGIRL